jgi:tRNA A-37 threonylcarbamoyl transferase component Bud32
MRLENDGVRWEVQPAFAAILKSVLAAPGEPIKISPVKAVTRHRLDDRVFYIKRYQYGHVPFRSWKYHLRSSQARQEWELARALEARGVPIVEHLALGERRSWAGLEESILVTAGFEGIPLEAAPATDPVAVQRFVERLHAAGVLQRDLHPGNLLVRAVPFEIRLVDLHGTVLKERLTPDERAENLARLNVSFPLPVDRAVRSRAAVLRRRLWFTRSRRALRRNRDFARRKFGGLTWWVRLDRMTDAARAILEDPDRFLAGRARILKPGRSSTVGAGDGLVLKRYNFRKVGNLFKDLVRPSKARRAYRKAYHLELAGIPTARIVATADRRWGGWLRRSYVLMEEIPGAVELGAYLAKGGPVEAHLVQQVGGLIGAMHREGLTHRDLKESNLVFDATGRLHLLDLDGLEFVDVVGRERTRADLNRFARGVERWGRVEPRHRSAFLRHYCRVRGAGPRALGLR